MKKQLAFVLSFVIFIVAFIPLGSFAAYDNSFESVCNILYMENLDMGTVVFNKNAELRTAPASLTKIMTAVVVIEKAEDPNKIITVSHNAMNSIYGTNSSSAGLKAEEELSIKNLLAAMMIQSANEAAEALADYFGEGNINSFIDMMNERARQLGLSGTHYENAHGLDVDGHYTTAKDIAVLTKHALTLPLFKEIVESEHYALPATNKNPARELSHTNLLMNPKYRAYYYEYAKGIKTGTTDKAGFCLVSRAERDGYNYLCVAMQGPQKDMTGDGYVDNSAFLTVKKAFKWAFSHLTYAVVASKNDIAKVVKVNYGKKTDSVCLVPKNDVSALVPEGVDSSQVKIVPKDTTKSEVNAPVKKGEVLGSADVYYAGESVATVELVASDSVGFKLSSFIFQKIIKSKIFLAAAGLALIFIVLIFIIRAKNKRKRRNKKYRNETPRVIKRIK